MTAAVAEESEKTENIGEQLAMLEAALYVAGRPLDLKALGYVIRTRSKKKVRQLAKTLIKEYNSRDTALEVLELEDERFVLQLKADYSSRVRRLALRPLLSDGPLRTLAYIAYRQPVLQKQVIDARGRHAYGHVRQLADMGLVDYEKKGRNKVLRATEFFADYFGLSHDFKKMKRQLVRIFNDLSKGNESLSRAENDPQEQLEN